MTAMKPVQDHELKAGWIDTKLGPMLAITDATALYLLEFTETKTLGPETAQLAKKLRVTVCPGRTSVTEQITHELEEYFSGRLTSFHTPLAITGTPFQKTVWQALLDVPYGATASYREQAQAIGRPTACRAVANANGANKIAIVLPCHRIIGSNGSLVGYASGLHRKEWLLKHEQNYRAELPHQHLAK